MKANRVAQDTSATVRALLDGIETVRVIKTDIHYMALNSNLRCSKLGGPLHQCGDGGAAYFRGQAGAGR